MESMLVGNKPLFSLGKQKNIDEQECQQLESFGSGRSVTPQYSLVHSAILAAAKSHTSTLAAQHNSSSLNYAELLEQSNKLAHSLSAAGVRPGVAVGIFLRRSVDMVVAILAVLRLGACYVPQDVSLIPRSTLKHVVEDAGIEVILTTKDFRADLASTFLGKVKTIEALVLEAANSSNEVHWQGSPEQRAFILYTSGTTGKPNGVQVTHRNLCSLLLSSPGDLGMRAGARVAQLLNIGFDMAAWEILGALTHASTLVIRQSNIEETAAKCQILIATPSILSKIDPLKCHAVEAVAVAGEPCPINLAQTWGAVTRFHNCCGPTETTIVNTLSTFTPGAQLTIGSPSPNNTVYILDSNGDPCPLGVIGEMWAGGDCVTAGYLNNEKLNATRYKPDPFLQQGRMMFRTGDLGQWTTEGELLHHGRVDDQVKIRGFRVELDGVSAQLERTENCTRAVTLKLDDQNLVGFVQPASTNTDQAIRRVKEALPYYCVPVAVFALPALPLTPRGKLDKRELLSFARQCLANEKQKTG